MKKHLRFVVLALMIFPVALSACLRFPVSAITGSTDDINGDQVPAAAVKAREALAAKLGTSLGEIAIASFTQTTWQDSCLGLGGIAESCLQVMVEGWRVELSANGVTYTAHTDGLGDQVRFEP